MEEDDQPRRLLDIDPDEVSLVDLAANKRRFLVTKRLETAQHSVEHTKKNEDVMADETQKEGMDSGEEDMAKMDETVQPTEKMEDDEDSMPPESEEEDDMSKMDESDDLAMWLSAQMEAATDEKDKMMFAHALEMCGQGDMTKAAEPAPDASAPAAEPAQKEAGAEVSKAFETLRAEIASLQNVVTELEKKPVAKATEEVPPAPEPDYVTRAEFDALLAEVAKATQAQAQIAKRFATLEAVELISKGADDIFPPEDPEKTKVKKSDSDIFSNIFAKQLG